MLPSSAVSNERRDMDGSKPDEWMTRNVRSIDAEKFCGHQEARGTKLKVVTCENLALNLDAQIAVASQRSFSHRLVAVARWVAEHITRVGHEKRLVFATNLETTKLFKWSQSRA